MATKEKRSTPAFGPLATTFLEKAAAVELKAIPGLSSGKHKEAKAKREAALKKLPFWNLSDSQIESQDPRNVLMQISQHYKAMVLGVEHTREKLIQRSDVFWYFFPYRDGGVAATVTLTFHENQPTFVSDCLRDRVVAERQAAKRAIYALYGKSPMPPRGHNFSLPGGDGGSSMPSQMAIANHPATGPNAAPLASDNHHDVEIVEVKDLDFKAKFANCVTNANNGKQMQRNDVEYTVKVTPQGLIGSVTLRLPGDSQGYEGRTWEGLPIPGTENGRDNTPANQQRAQQSAAAAALMEYDEALYTALITNPANGEPQAKRFKADGRPPPPPR